MTIINVRASSAPQKESLYPVTLTPHFSPNLPTNPALICCLSVHICLFWMFRVNGIIRHVVFMNVFLHLA